MVSFNPPKNNYDGDNDDAEGVVNENVVIDDEEVRNEEAMKIYELAADFTNQCSLEPRSAGDTQDEFEDDLREMMATVEECDGDNMDGMKAIIDGWINTEDTDFCKQELADEVKALLDLDVICNLKEPENDKDEQEDEADAAKPKAIVTTENWNQLATRLKTLSVEIAELGDNFCLVSTGVADAEDDLRRVFRKMNNAKNAGKAKKLTMSGRQSNLMAFMHKVPPK